VEGKKKMSSRIVASVIGSTIAILFLCGQVSTPQALEEVLLKGLSINSRHDDYSRQLDPVTVIKSYQRAGLIAMKRDQRGDYDNYYHLLKPITLMGHDLVLIIESHGREAGDGTGDHPDEGITVVVRVAGDTQTLVHFAETNKCEFDPDYATLQEDWDAFPRHHSVKFPQGTYAKLRCTEDTSYYSSQK
jgi:hypothetical protein